MGALILDRINELVHDKYSDGAEGRFGSQTLTGWNV